MMQLILALLPLAVLAAKFRLEPADPGDLFPVWVGSAAVLHGHDPYEAETTDRIQLRVYGRELSQYEVAQGRDQHRFAYPAYVAFVLAPLTGLSYQSSLVLTCGIFAVLIAISIPLWLRVIGWHPPPAMLAWILAIVLLSPVTSRGLRLVQVGILAGFFLSAAAFALARNHLLLAGILLAAASIKPQLALLPTAWLMLWTLSAFSRHRRLLFGFALTLALLIAGATALVPRWLPHFLEGMKAYRHYTGAPSVFDAVLGRPWSLPPTALVLTALAMVAWRSRYADPSTKAYAFALALSLAATAWAVPANFDIYNQLLSLPLVFLLGRRMQERSSEFHARGNA
jgi:Glycosyltransferase family 87